MDHDAVDTIEISNIRIAITNKENPDDVLKKIFGKITNHSFRIIKKSLDTRKKNYPYYIYTVEFIYSKELQDQLIKAFSTSFSIKTDKKNRNNTNCNDNIFSKSYFANRKNTSNNVKILIVGFGPAGIFSTLSLLEHGIIPEIIEMGKPVEERMQDIHSFFKSGTFNPYSNINYGEGGAGTYSDGKLTTRTKNPSIETIFNYLVQFGADPSILYENNPHLGTDVLKKIMINCRHFMISKGVAIHFNTKLIDIKTKKPHICLLQDLETGKQRDVEFDSVILCTGHSNSSIYTMLYENNIALSPKTFAAGFRVEHPAKFINQNQYGKNAPRKHLPTASYSLIHKATASVSIYSFCMCPGGIILPSTSEADAIVTNGASNSARNGKYSNAAIVATINSNDFSNIYNQILNKIKTLHNKGIMNPEHFAKIMKSNDPATYTDYLPELPSKSSTGKQVSSTKSKFKHVFEGVFIQKLFETCIKKPSHLRAPSQPLKNIVNASEHSKIWNDEITYKTTYAHGTYDCNLLYFFPDEYLLYFKAALQNFDNKINGFISEGMAIGYETRTSSPIKVQRSENLELVGISGKNIKNFYFAGEGSGWAGGITTSALDGYLTAKKVIENLE